MVVVHLAQLSPLFGLSPLSSFLQYLLFLLHTHPLICPIAPFPSQCCLLLHSCPTFWLPLQKSLHHHSTVVSMIEVGNILYGRSLMMVAKEQDYMSHKTRLLLLGPQHNFVKGLFFIIFVWFWWLLIIALISNLAHSEYYKEWPKHTASPAAYCPKKNLMYSVYNKKAME